MQLIPDDPIIDCIQRTGYPPWIDPDWEDDEDEWEDEEPLPRDISTRWFCIR